MEIKLRKWQLDDVENLVLLANNMNVAKNLTNRFPFPYTRADGENFIKFASGEGSHRIFAIEIEGVACGAVGVHPLEDIFCKNAELGYWLGEPYWNKGIMPIAVAKIVAFTFENLPHIDRIFARPFAHNIGSQRVLEKNGFVLEAKFEKTLFKNNEYIDEWVYAIRRPN
ncbi:MAG: hypothetical protein RL757_1933 [Bacteroidota bacterium]|jgi:RimJ/RimL family protein N-acetyltransferase